jgi:hypothetical protein
MVFRYLRPAFISCHHDATPPCPFHAAIVSPGRWYGHPLDSLLNIIVNNIITVSPTPAAGTNDDDDDDINILIVVLVLLFTVLPRSLVVYGTTADAPAPG